MDKTKTWKRETAFLLLLGLAYVVWTGDVAMVQVLVWPIFSFAGLAFGLDVYSKSDGMRQVPPIPTVRGSTQYSSAQYSSRETEQPDPRFIDRAGVWRDDDSSRQA